MINYFNKKGLHICRTTKLPPTYVRNYTSKRKIRLGITKAIIKMHNHGALLGPFPNNENYKKNLHISPVFGNIKKSSGKINFIHDLSAPVNGISVNSEIPEHHRTVHYITIKEICTKILKQGPNCYMWVSDYSNAYWLAAIQPKFYKLMGFMWRNKIFIMTSLTYGLASAPQLFTKIAFSIICMITNKYPQTFTDNETNERLIDHYLDDVWGIGNNHKCDQQFKLWKQFNMSLGMKLSDTKISKPSQKQKLLGWIFDIKNSKLYLPSDKRERYLKNVKRIYNNGKVSLNDIREICGQLRHVCQVVFSGPATMRGLERLKTWMETLDPKEILYPKRLNKYALHNLRTWIVILTQLEKYKLDIPYIVKSPKDGDIHIWTDAASKVGIGGFSTKGEWTQIKFKQVNPKLIIDNIMWMEMLAVVVLFQTFAHNWKGKSVTIHCDNKPAVGCFAKKRTKFNNKNYLAINHLIIKLVDICVKYQIYYWATYIKGEKNNKADSLSRFYNDPLHIYQEGLKKYKIKFDNKMTNCIKSFYEVLVPIKYD